MQQMHRISSFYFEKSFKLNMGSQIVGVIGQVFRRDDVEESSKL
jgi:hypothetical protein